MGTITTFDHTADVGMTVHARDLDDLFRTAAEGLFDYVVTNREDLRETISESVTLQADTLADLLNAWLNELIFRSETQHRLYRRFDLHVTGEGRSLRAEIRGEPIDRDRHVLDHEVKAVTQHGFSVRQKGSEWVADMILDI